MYIYIFSSEAKGSIYILRTVTSWTLLPPSRRYCICYVWQGVNEDKSFLCGFFAQQQDPFRLACQSLQTMLVSLVIKQDLQTNGVY